MCSFGIALQESECKSLDILIGVFCYFSKSFWKILQKKFVQFSEFERLAGFNFGICFKIVKISFACVCLVVSVCVVGSKTYLLVTCYISDCQYETIK